MAFTYRMYCVKWSYLKSLLIKLSFEGSLSPQLRVGSRERNNNHARCCQALRIARCIIKIVLDVPALQEMELNFVTV